MDERNVILTGFMGTGKTAVGQLLAARLGRPWVDTDALIEHRHGPIARIFAERGEEAFRGCEAAVARELADQSGLVISTGGRLMLDPENARALGRGRVYCLDASADEILRRLASEANAERPLLAGPDPAERIRSLLIERAAGYAVFEQVATDGRSALDVVDDIVMRLGTAQPSN